MLPWRMTFEASYVGSRTQQLQNRWAGFNEPSLALRDRCDPSKGGNPGVLQRAAAEPVLPGAGLRRHGAVHEPDAVAL